MNSGLDSDACPAEPMSARYISYRNYLLTFLIVLFAFNYVDFLGLGMALQSIKAELHLSDTELGLLSGLAFWLFYATFGLSMGRWADRGNRVTVLFVTRLLWVVFVILTGRATSFLQLLIFRAGAAVGESGCLPAATSLISDHFPRSERPRAMGLFYLGAPCASLITFVASGWLLQLYGWRVMFTVIGLPGILLALLTRLTLLEPRTQRNFPPADIPQGTHTSPEPTQLPFRQALRTLCTNATYRNLLLAFVISYFFSSSYQWQAPYFAREYGLKSGMLGTWLSIVYGIPGVFGTALGGIIASHWAKRNERLQLAAVAVLYCCAGLLLTAVYLTHNYYLAFVLIGLSITCFNLQSGPVFSALQTVVPSRLRAVSLMVVYFFANLIGTGLGPLFVGAISDLLHPFVGVQSLRYALTMMGPWILFGGLFMWRASKTIGSDIDAVQRQ